VPLGDLAKKKTYPALFHLHRSGLIPSNVIIMGYARTEMSRDEFQKRIAAFLPKNFEDERTAFLARCYYASGGYDSREAMRAMVHDRVLALEPESVGEGFQGANRIFYMALPPSVFVKTAAAVRAEVFSSSGWNRVIVEKPFGKDLESSAKLNENLSTFFAEDQIYRIDHYLGKEMAQNMMVLRFANAIFEPIWNRYHIANVKITFKENFGTEGRAGYFDEFGIIRDVMQNHLLQLLALVAMECPASLSAEDVRDEKVKVLRAIDSIGPDDIIVGQYVRDAEGKGESYFDDKDVPRDSVTPTFAQSVLFIKNQRWAGVPFILKCGKGLNERKAEIRIQFKKAVPEELFPSAVPNELVLRVQPNEAIYLKMMTKVPGLSSELSQSELDLSYKERFDTKHNPDAYERLILDVVRGDHNLFVRVDELQAAWRIFTPMLHKLESEKLPPLKYVFGTRGPEQADELAEKWGWRRYEGYNWPGDAKNKKQ
jgi:glucose-6-phosphate 1-dehydrogenase